MKTQNIIILVIVIAVAIAGGWYFSTKTSDDASFVNSNSADSINTEDIVLVINDEEISRDQYETFKAQIFTQQGIDATSLEADAESEIESQITEELIAQKLIEQEVARLDIESSPEEIDQQIEVMKAQFGGEEAFQGLLDAQGLSKEELRAKISADLATQVYLEQALNFSSITVTDQEINSAYEEIAAQDENIPPLDEIRPQVEQFVIQQKQQPLVAELIDELRQEADIEILL